jgi:hypothetical protein
LHNTWDVAAVVAILQYLHSTLTYVATMAVVLLYCTLLVRMWLLCLLEHHLWLLCMEHLKFLGVLL